MNTQTKTEETGRGASDLSCIVVTYQPDISILRCQFNGLPEDAGLLVVDNASSPTLVAQMTQLLESRPRSRFLRNPENRGLAAAINQGIKEARDFWPDTEYALLLDQDSEPLTGAIEELLDQARYLRTYNANAACVGPSLFDLGTGLHHGFHQQKGWLWKRVRPLPGDSRPVRCSSLNGSGTLVPIDLFESLGGLDESLFIDHVDTEWAFHVLAKGHALYGVPQAEFLHRMGENSKRIWLLGWRPWPMRSPQRHQWLFRNAVILMRRPYIPITWKGWAIAKLTLTVLVQLMIDPQRGSQLRHMAHGIWEGIRKKDVLRRGMTP